MMACPDCGQEHPSEAILLRHREFEHSESLEAEGSARAAQEAVQEDEGRFTPDGFYGARAHAPLPRRPTRPRCSAVCSPRSPALRCRRGSARFSNADGTRRLGETIGETRL
jgi:hypothetical protein